MLHKIVESSTDKCVARVPPAGHKGSMWWYSQTLVISTIVMPGQSGRQYMEWGIMGYSPSLSKTSKKTLRGVEGSGGGTSRVCKLSSAIWGYYCLSWLRGLIPTKTITLLCVALKTEKDSPGCLGQQTRTPECFLSLACLLTHIQHSVV